MWLLELLPLIIGTTPNSPIITSSSKNYGVIHASHQVKAIEPCRTMMICFYNLLDYQVSLLYLTAEPIFDTPEARFVLWMWQNFLQLSVFEDGKNGLILFFLKVVLFLKEEDSLVHKEFNKLIGLLIPLLIGFVTCLWPAL